MGNRSERVNQLELDSLGVATMKPERTHLLSTLLQIK